MRYLYQAASTMELERLWDIDIAAHTGDDRWPMWKNEYLAMNARGECRTFVILADDLPIGQGTLLFSPECGAVSGRTALADGKHIANINSLRIQKAYEGQGHVSALIRKMERYAKDAGYDQLTIGVQARETRNLGIYLHWGYTSYVLSEGKGSDLILYYQKTL